MIVKAKKKEGSHVARLAAGGEIKEVLLNEDLTAPARGGVQICFRSMNSSGIVELSEMEARDLYQTLGEKIKLIGKSRVIKEKF
jgi:hypothetical protein